MDGAEMTKLAWFRLYSEVIYDAKINRVSRLTGASKMEVVGVWVTLLALANDSSDRGALLIADGVPYTLSDLYELTDLPQERLDRIFEHFKELDMLSFDQGVFRISNWDARQFKSDSSTERVQRFRNRQKETGGNGYVTLQKRFCNAPDTDTDTDTEAELNTTAGEIFVCYEHEIGALTPMIAERLKDFEQTYPDSWVVEAIKLAVENNARNLSYVDPETLESGG